MPREIFPISICILTDGVHPKNSSILHLSAKYNAFTFSANVLPERTLKRTKTWEAHPEEFDKLKQDARPLREVIKDFRVWLAKFPGKLVAVTTGVDFWHLMNAMMEYKGRATSTTVSTSTWPFGYNFIDIGTYVAASKKVETVSNFSGVDASVVLAKREQAFLAAKEKLKESSLEW